MKQRRLPSSASWIPILWLTIISSRPVSFWLQCIGIESGATNNLDGNPTDLAIFLGLMLAAVIVLARRNFAWAGFIQGNKSLILLYLYLALTALWAEHSFPTLKRAMKDFGSVLVALVMLTEQSPMDVIRIAFVRIAYVLFPLSIIFIKYFPDIGRQASRGGDSMFRGVCMHKSSLGCLVFLFGLFILIDLLEIRRNGGKRNKRLALWVRYGLLVMGGWLMYTCGSVTSLICFTLGAAILWASARLVRMGNPARMIFRYAALLACVFILEKTFDVSTVVLQALGKNKTLTGRTEIWDMVEEANTPVLTGTGFYSFWGTREAERIQEHFAGVMNSAHNGFLDMYLDGGLVGVVLLVVLVLGWGGRSLGRMLRGSLFGRVAFMVWLLGLFYNNSETAFFRLDPVWFTLLLMMIECPPVFRSTETGQLSTQGEPALQAA